MDAEGLRLRLGASSVTLGGLLEHLAWVEELYFQNYLVGRQSMAPLDQLDLKSDWDPWTQKTAAEVTPGALCALWADAVHRSRGALADLLREQLDGATGESAPKDLPVP